MGETGKSTKGVEFAARQKRIPCGHAEWRTESSRHADHRGKKAYLQAGAGIVADSDPQSEFEETENKARAVLRAVEMARGRG